MGALFTTFGIDWHLLIAQTINFGILAALLTWLLYKPVLNMVKERERIITKGVNDAEESAKRLTETGVEIQARTHAAEVEASDIVEQARRAALDERAKLLKEAEARALAIARDADARAKETAVRSMRESEREVARLAVLAAEKIMKK